MKGNSATRLGRLLGYLGTHPRHIWTYLTTGPLTSRTPLQLGVPWFSTAAIEFLDSFVTPSMDVFEYGSGGSTVYFARRCSTVISTEDDSDWLRMVEGEVADRGLKNVALQYRPFNFKNTEQFECSEYLRSIPHRKFDIIVVDGMEGGVTVRPACFQYAEGFVSEGGIIIVDDSWRYPELRSANRARSFREFRSTGPCRPGVTSTDVFFY
jgi:hypothetical protein